MRSLYVPLLFFATAVSAPWHLALTESTASFRGICNARLGVIWASGDNGTVLRSEDDGYMWQKCSVPSDAAKLDFRAVVAWNANHAFILSSGTGSASRLFETIDGCATWHVAIDNPDRDGFWDSLTFHGKTGLILGDPVAGRFVVYQSDDLGRHWHRDNSPGLTAAVGEGVFAASNSSLAVVANSEPVFVTGGNGGPRFFRRNGSGEWSAVKLPISGGNESSGAFSVAFRDPAHGLIVGGDYKQPGQSAGTAAWTADGGATWNLTATFPSGYRSSVGWDSALKAWIAAGPSGSELSRDDGRTWKQLDSGNWNALSLPWIAGPKGRIASLDPGNPLLQ